MRGKEKQADGLGAGGRPLNRAWGAFLWKSHLSRDEEGETGGPRSVGNGEGMKDPKESFQGRVNFVYFPKIKAEISWGGHTPLDGLRDAPPELCPGAASWWGQMGQSSPPAPPEQEHPSPH